jgi:hypothetical protein
MWAAQSWGETRSSGLTEASRKHKRILRLQIMAMDAAAETGMFNSWIRT